MSNSLYKVSFAVNSDTDINSPIYVGESAYLSTKGIYLVLPSQASEVEVMLNNTVEFFDIEYVAPFNVLIFINSNLLGNATKIFGEVLLSEIGNVHFKLLIN
ncbi:hypothetical protein [Acidianus sp. RZ1]|uniref:hypothetical protein n=1 Tax=Acidianus sp. RZ1 TaxID=1540082 RepID=UPI001491B5C8|nr:hypothetical protein [Acidianus sp. RZ1]NON61252.1 hypothetical protein [Acidianus sp. RZ1]